jgi:Cu/Ag efflux protein CusF
MTYTPPPRYNYRQPPDSYSSAWFGQELASIQRGIPVVSLLQWTRTVTAAYALVLEDVVVRADATARAVAVTLPKASQQVGRVVTVKKVDASASAVTVTCAGTDTIDGAASTSLATQYQSVTLQSFGTGWDVLARV